ncbi:hypothetical protein [Streptomyces fulvoviolaceus]|uniref:hypothetical protein n=1 Tax=Streptomyces fulvoviolaceus TaxID=285535 RepID=UPI00131D31A6|nr:hypothetical protein [Streptomyces fulvoviolaceus]
MKAIGRILALVATLASCALTSTTAHASESATQADCYTTYNIYDPTKVGYMDWNADPNSCYSNGDAFRVCDTKADGWGVAVTTIDAGIREATTAGHSSPYCSPWVTGNITEGKEIEFNAYLVKGSSSVHLGSITVTA